MSPAGHHHGGVAEGGRYLSCLCNHTKRLGQGVKSPTGKPCPSEDAVGGPWRPCALLLPTRARGGPPMPCCPEAPKQAHGPWPGPVHLENPESRPSGLPAALLPPGCAPPGADSRLLTSYSPMEPPLPLIPFLFGFNVPNPLSRHGDRGRRTVRAGVWGKSRRMTGGPGGGGAQASPLCTRTLFNSQESVGTVASSYRPGHWLGRTCARAWMWETVPAPNYPWTV